jgi:hypothetical protein
MTHIDWNHPDMKLIQPEKLELLKLAASELGNMSTDASLSYILALNAKLKEQNISFSTEEFNILLKSLSGDLPSFLTNMLVKS